MKSSNRYEIKKVLGQGGMGTVYLGFDTYLERNVAIKTISSSVHHNNLNVRFIQEAKSVGQLNHPNIVTIYDFGMIKGHLFIVMEYLKGTNLQTLIKEKKTINIITKLEIILQICLGLDYTHKKQIVHKDIKPGNIFVLENGTTKIVDFGLAEIQASQVTQNRYLLGSPPYFSPERIQGAECNSRSDQFAVGLIFYELLTFQRAFQGLSISEISNNILHNEPRSLIGKTANLYPELGNIIKRSIMKRPENRYQSMDVMALDIKEIIEKMKNDSFSSLDPLSVSKKHRDTQKFDSDTTVYTVADNTKGIKNRNILKLNKSFYLLCISITIIIFLTLSFSLIFKISPSFTDLFDNKNTGYFAFNVKPYVHIEEIINLQTKKKIKLNAPLKTTPLFCEMDPGDYKIVYRFSKEKDGFREKTITIVTGKTTCVQDIQDDYFVFDAINYFKIPL